MFHLLTIVQVSLAILLIALVLVQKVNTDASGAFSADGGNHVSLEKRGAEKLLHRMTIYVAVFLVASLAYPLVTH